MLEVVAVLHKAAPFSKKEPVLVKTSSLCLLDSYIDVYAGIGHRAINHL